MTHDDFPPSVVLSPHRGDVDGSSTGGDDDSDSFSDGSSVGGDLKAPAPTTPSSYRSLLFGRTGRGGGGGTSSGDKQMTASTATGAAALFATSLWKNKRHILLLTFLMVLVMKTIIILSDHQNRIGIQRIWQFWSSVTPWILEYKWKEFKLETIDKLPRHVVDSRLEEFHQRTAHKSVQLIQEMGGIYVKFGQIASTLGTGILQDDYVRAMEPLQDGIPPRSLAEIGTIFEQSTGKRLEDAFEWFDDKPIGAASIAQAHKAILKKKKDSNNANDADAHDDVVIVKIQYPEVAKLFNADLNNLEIVTRLLLPGSLDMVKAARERHCRELDFHSEADHLRECRYNLQQHNNMEPNLVRIPIVRNETGLCTSEVLVMEFLDGLSLNTVIEQEQDRMARALGKEDGQALREFVLERIGEHLEQTHANATEVGGHHYFDDPNHPHNRILERIVTSNIGATIFRSYVGFRDRIDRFQHGIGNLFSSKTKRIEQRQRRPPTVRVPMGRILKTLVKVHGLQMLRDGVFNADPHGGNVIVMKDGRLGLLDYGMVGRATPYERKQMAKLILALRHQDTTAVTAVYRRNGYRASWAEGDVYDNPEIVRRFAQFHFDRFDMSPISMASTTTPTTGDNANQKKKKKWRSNNHNHNKPKRRKCLDILDTTIEWSVPDWVEQGRRLTGILAGVSLRAGRPMSMAKEWSTIAQEVLDELEEKNENHAAEEEEEEEGKGGEELGGWMMFMMTFTRSML